MIMKKQGTYFLIGITLIFFGVLLFVLPPIVRRVNANQQFAPVVAESDIRRIKPPEEAVTGKAVYLSIPSISLGIEVVDGIIDVETQTWTLTKDKAQFAAITSPPNNIAGNTFIYGHNRKEVFSKLLKIQDGAVAYVKTDNSLVFMYVYRSRQTTTPTDVSIFDYQGPPILTLQTCTGMFFQNRELFTFDFKGVQ